MDHTLAECGLRLRYLRERRTIDAIDRQQLFTDLLEGTPVREAAAWAVRPVLATYDHVVLAHDLKTDTPVGLLGAHDHQTPSGSFLWLETGFVAKTARGRNLLRRMIALLLIRTITLDRVPAAVAAMTCNPVAVHVLRQMEARLDGARFMPAPEQAVIDLRAIMLARDVTTALGRRFQYVQTNRATAAGLEAVQAGRHTARAAFAVSPMLAMLDFHGSSEGGLIADLRKLYRLKPGRILRTSPASVPPNIAAPDPAGRALKL